MFTRPPGMLFFFFFNDTATTEIYTLSLHDALPICSNSRGTHIAGPQSVKRQPNFPSRSEEHTSELQSHSDLVCRLLLEKKKTQELGIQPEPPALHRADPPVSLST